jgi:hypothetical protein
MNSKDERMNHHRINLHFMLLLLIFLAGYLPGCEKGPLSRKHREISEKIILQGFEEVSVNDIFNVVLKNDTVFSVEFTGREDILKNVSLISPDNSLFIHDNNAFKWLPDYPRVTATISFPDLNILNINSASRISSPDTLFVSGLTIMANAQLIEADLILHATAISLVTGSDNYGHYTLKGFAHTSLFNISGSAQLWAGDLETGRAQVENRSTGDCYVNVNNELRVWLEHYGNIYYTGSPDHLIIESRTSRGNLIRIR